MNYPVDSSVTIVTTTTTSAVDAPVTASVPWPLPPSFKSSKKIDLTMSGLIMKAVNFKNKREGMQISPDNVAWQVNIIFAKAINPPLCGSKILLFESGSLPVAEMRRIHTYLQEWLVDVTRVGGLVEKCDQKANTFFNRSERFILTLEFTKNDCPNKHEIQEIMKRIGGNGLVTPEKVMAWFKKTRLSERRARSRRTILK